MTISPSTFGMSVGGVGFQVHLPDDTWLAALAPLGYGLLLTGSRPA